MSSVALFAQLAKAMQSEYQAVSVFVNILQNEQRLLLESHSQELLKLSQKKNQQVAVVTQLSEQRHRLLAQVLDGKELNELSGIQITELLQQKNPKLQQGWQTLLNAAREAYRLNQMNGELIQMRLRHNHQALAALNQAAQNNSLYGPNGQHNFAKNSGRTIGSV